MLKENVGTHFYYHVRTIFSFIFCGEEWLHDWLTGTSARLATLVENGVLQEGGSFFHECITDGQFVGEVLSSTKVGEYEAIIPKVTGQAFITGFHQFVMDPRDPLKQGFLLA